MVGGGSGFQAFVLTTTLCPIGIDIGLVILDGRDEGGSKGEPRRGLVPDKVTGFGGGDFSWFEHKQGLAIRFRVSVVVFTENGGNGSPMFLS